MKKYIKVLFWGASERYEFLDDVKRDIEIILDILTKEFKEIFLINGGYQGTMKIVPQLLAEKASENDSQIYTQAILFDGFKNDPFQSPQNEPNQLSDTIISTSSIGERVHAMIDLGDIFIALPGKTGTLHEIIQAIETVRYGMNYEMVSQNLNRIFVHKNWQPIFDNLNATGNISNEIFKDLQKCYFSFKGKREKKRESFIKRLQRCVESVELEDRNSYSFPSSFNYVKRIRRFTDQSKFLEKENRFGLLIQQLENVICGDYDIQSEISILGLDIVVSEFGNDSENKLLRLETIGTAEYLKLLDKFLQEFISISIGPSFYSEWRELNRVQHNLGNHQLYYHNHKAESEFSGTEDSTLEHWQLALLKSGIGNTLYAGQFEIATEYNEYRVSSFILFKSLVPKSLRSKIESKLNRWKSEIVFEDVVRRSTVDLHNASIKKSEALLQAATSQVFARNFAHNIGSHVAIRSTNKMIKKRIKLLFNLSDDDINKNIEVINWIDFISERLDLFEVSRNEFLAEPRLQPYNAMLYRDVILPFCENTLILDNIANSEGVGYHHNNCCNQLKIRVIINGAEITASYPDLEGYNGESEINYPNNFPYLLKHKAKRDADSLLEAYTNKQLQGAEDIEICLTSAHTLYSILENKIRNSAKHNKDKLGGQELEIFIEIVELMKDDINNAELYYTIRIYDNLSMVSAQDLEEFYISIKEDLVSPEGVIVKKHLGITDMKINAYLMKTDRDITNEGLNGAIDLLYKHNDGKVKKSLDFIGTENGFTRYAEPSKLKLGVYEDEIFGCEKKYDFAYQFKLSKPQKVVWFRSDIDKSRRAKYLKKGMHFYDNIAEFATSRDSENSLAKYEFAILELNVVKDLSNEYPSFLWDEFLLRLPHRVIVNAEEKELEKYPILKDLIANKRIAKVSESVIELPRTNRVLGNSSEEIEDWDFYFLKSCWKHWLKKWISDGQEARLLVYLEENPNQVGKWKDNLIEDNFLQVDFFSDASTASMIPKISNNSKFVLYDHHGYGYSHLKDQEILNTDSKEFINNRTYFNFDKGSRDYVDLFFPDSNPKKNVYRLFKAFEAGLTRILILDERITDLLSTTGRSDKNVAKAMRKNGFNSGKKEPRKADYADLANNGNTFIVDTFNKRKIKNVPDNVSFSMEGNNLSIEMLRDIDFPLAINKGTKRAFEFDALIIHRTYLNHLLKEFQRSEHKKMMHSFYKKFSRVVIVSGGGAPHSIEFPFIFKPFSKLDECFWKYPSKMAIIKLI